MHSPHFRLGFSKIRGGVAWYLTPDQDWIKEGMGAIVPPPPKKLRPLKKEVAANVIA